MKPLQEVGKVLMEVNGEVMEVTMQAGDVALKTLGEHANPALFWTQQLQVVEKRAVEFAKALETTRLTQGAAKMLWEQKFMPAVRYRLLFATVTEKEVEQAIAPAWKAYRKKLRLTSGGISNYLLKAMGIGEVWHKLKVDRLLTPLLLLPPSLPQCLVVRTQQDPNCSHHCLVHSLLHLWAVVAPLDSILCPLQHHLLQLLYPFCYPLLLPPFQHLILILRHL